MNSLELAIKKSLQSSGARADVNKAYLEFIKANFIIPVDKKSSLEDPKVLYLEEKGQFFLPVFTNKFYLNNWALEIGDTIRLLSLTGVDLLKGIGEKVTVCLNIGSDVYKEFNPGELARMKNMVLKLFKN